MRMQAVLYDDGDGSLSRLYAHHSPTPFVLSGALPSSYYFLPQRSQQPSCLPAHVESAILIDVNLNSPMQIIHA